MPSSPRFTWPYSPSAQTSMADFHQMLLGENKYGDEPTTILVAASGDIGNGQDDTDLSLAAAYRPVIGVRGHRRTHRRRRRPSSHRAAAAAAARAGGGGNHHHNHYTADRPPGRVGPGSPSPFTHTSRRRCRAGSPAISPHRTGKVFRSFPTLGRGPNNNSNRQ